MFKKQGDFITNKDTSFLKNASLVVGWNTTGDIQLRGNRNFALLLSRLAYVFDIIDDKIKSHQDYEEFIEILHGVRIKQTLIDNNFTLEEIADVLYQIDKAQSVAIVIREDDEETIRFLISFGAVIGFDKIGLFFEELDEDLFEFRLVQE
ncbi:MAG: hypothetical protein GXO40_00740 [Epsilonproteobacteria bacterium]|nr:hypothetical protein [Campylobacterota bacterium]